MFSQLLDFLDKDLAVLMFGQLSNRESLRDLALAMQALSLTASFIARYFVLHANISMEKSTD